MAGAGGGFGATVVTQVQRKMQEITLKKTGLGTPVLGGSGGVFCTVTDNGVGDYTINFTEAPFTQIPEIFVAGTTASRLVSVGTVTALAAQILVTDLSGVAAEGDFHMMAIGSLGRDLVGP